MALRSLLHLRRHRVGKHAGEPTYEELPRPPLAVLSVPVDRVALKVRQDNAEQCDAAVAFAVSRLHKILDDDVERAEGC